MADRQATIGVNVKTDAATALPKQFSDGMKKVAPNGVITVPVNLDTKGFRPLGKITGDMTQFRGSLEASTARVLAFGASASVLAGVGAALKNLVASGIEVQNTMIEINRVFNLSKSELSTFQSKLFDVARNTGQSFDVVGKAALELSRQGLSATETTKRLNDALTLTRLSGLDSAESVEVLTATINGFKNEALSSTEIVSKLIAVDSAFAVSTNDLANALSRSSATAQDAGVSFEQLIAITASLQQTTARGGSVIGNALKSIFTRVSGEKAREGLEAIGVATTDASGNFRGAIPVLQDYAKVYESLDDKTKSYTSNLIASVYQINILKALISDLKSENAIYTQGLEVATNATNGIAAANEKLNASTKSLITNTGTSLKQLGASIENLSVEGGIRRVLRVTENISESFNSLLEGQSRFGEAGKKAGEAFLGGIGDFLAGPGLALLAKVGFKLFSFLAKDVVVAVKEIGKINNLSAQQAANQAALFDVLSRNRLVMNQMLDSSISEVEKRRILNDQLVETLALNKQILGVARMVTEESIKAGSPSLVQRGVAKFNKVTGRDPNFAQNNSPLEEAIQRERMAGIPSSAIRVNQSDSLKSSRNPLGLAVTNILQEPRGLKDVFGGGRTKDIIPNFAMVDVYHGSSSYDLTKGTSLLSINKELKKRGVAGTSFDSNADMRDTNGRGLFVTQDLSTAKAYAGKNGSIFKTTVDTDKFLDVDSRTKTGLGSVAFYGMTKKQYSKELKSSGKLGMSFFDRERAELSSARLPSGLFPNSPVAKNFVITKGLKNLKFLRVPNFAKTSSGNALRDAINREKDAGIPNWAIRVNQSDSLISKNNPSGLAVTNSIQEPRGLRDVVGVRGGTVPNFALPSLSNPSSISGMFALGSTTNPFLALNSKIKDFSLSMSELAKEARSLGKSMGLNRSEQAKLVFATSQQRIALDQQRRAGILPIIPSRGAAGNVYPSGFSTKPSESSRFSGFGGRINSAVKGFGDKAFMGSIVGSIAGSGLSEAGYEKTGSAVSTIASFTGIGAIFGPWGAAGGAIIGLTKSIYDLTNGSSAAKKKMEELTKQISKTEQDSTKRQNELSAYATAISELDEAIESGQKPETIARKSTAVREAELGFTDPRTRSLALATGGDSEKIGELLRENAKRSAEESEGQRLSLLLQKLSSGDKSEKQAVRDILRARATRGLAANFIDERSFGSPLEGDVGDVGLVNAKTLLDQFFKQRDIGELLGKSLDNFNEGKTLATASDAYFGAALLPNQEIKGEGFFNDYGKSLIAAAAKEAGIEDSVIEEAVKTQEGLKSLFVAVKGAVSEMAKLSGDQLKAIRISQYKQELSSINKDINAGITIFAQQFESNINALEEAGQRIEGLILKPQKSFLSSAVKGGSLSSDISEILSNNIEYATKKFALDVRGKGLFKELVKNPDGDFATFNGASGVGYTANESKLSGVDFSRASKFNLGDPEGIRNAINNLSEKGKGLDGELLEVNNKAIVELEKLYGEAVTLRLQQRVDNQLIRDEFKRAFVEGLSKDKIFKSIEDLVSFGKGRDLGALSAFAGPSNASFGALTNQISGENLLENITKANRALSGLKITQSQPPAIGRINSIIDASKDAFGRPLVTGNRLIDKTKDAFGRPLAPRTTESKLAEQSLKSKTFLSSYNSQIESAQYAAFGGRATEEQKNLLARATTARGTITAYEQYTRQQRLNRSIFERTKEYQKGGLSYEDANLRASQRVSQRATIESLYNALDKKEKEQFDKRLGDTGFTDAYNAELYPASGRGVSKEEARGRAFESLSNDDLVHILGERADTNQLLASSNEKIKQIAEILSSSLSGKDASKGISTLVDTATKSFEKMYKDAKDWADTIGKMPINIVTPTFEVQNASLTTEKDITVTGNNIEVSSKTDGKTTSIGRGAPAAPRIA